MNKFVEHMSAIKKVARKLSYKFNGRFDDNELINAAYIFYRRAINNNPSLVEGQFSKLSTFLFRVKNDMLEYIVKEADLRKIHVPVFNTTSFQSPEEEDKDYFEPASTENGYEKIDNDDFLEETLMSASLSDDEWSIIQGYFYEERTLKDVGRGIGRAECTVSVKKKEMCKKLLEVSHNMV